MTANVQIPTTLRPRRTQTAVLFTLSLLFSLGGLWMVSDGEREGYLCAGFFGLCLVVFALQFHPRASYLCLSADGFTFCVLFRTHTVRWAHVREFGVTFIGFRTVAWNFSWDHPISRGARAVGRFICGYEATLPDTYGMKPHELAELMDSLRQRYTEPRTVIRPAA